MLGLAVICELLGRIIALAAAIWTSQRYQKRSAGMVAGIIVGLALGVLLQFATLFIPLQILGG
jgi:hypothetical protein